MNNEGVIMDDTKSIILAIESQVFSMGANDYEKSMFDSLFRRLDTGELTEEEALEEANRILNEKQDYH